MTPGRQYGITLGALAAAGAVMLAALGQVWVTATVGGGGTDQPSIVFDYTGRTMLPVAAGAGILLLAGIAGVIATRGVGRIIVGALLLIAALGAVAAAVGYGLDAAAAGRSRAVADAGMADVVVVGSSWWLVVAVAGFVAALAALAVVLRGRRWPVLGGRYERRGDAAGAAVAPDVMTPAQAWDALDRGEDPTRAAEVTE